ncbi:efflux transporter outer membrane subunit [Asticcacaulis sp. EMRT-3]|uniref:efflux transporter outer membrane subunit n=1 Tax=Asticcacaulis sp. EMRT-3 TaxID=3040349 RepID=UPI0024AF1CC9|nr:efflux transporter outer membrane subunit [Asticcacaulis sp. EMRT-3]MDI7776088.1 efflux transporter outer membrane subunit [Asticcacaulis sp. EMRT-3]
MSSPITSLSVKPLNIKAFAAVSVLALLSACASVPQSTTMTPLKASDLAASQSLAGQAGAQWPAQNWWTGFNDPQIDALMQEAFAHSPDLQAAQARIEKAEAQSAQIKAATQADASFNITDSVTKQSINMGTPSSVSFGSASFDPREILPQGYQNLTRVSLDANYDLDFWGKSRAAIKGAGRAAEAAQVDATAARQTLAATIAQAYVELDRLYAAQDQLSAMKQAADDKLSLNQALADHQLITKDAVLAVQDQQAQLTGRIAATDGAIRGQKNLLAALVGAGPDRGLSITRPHLAPVDVNTLPENVTLDLLGRRADVVAARLRVEAQSAGIKYARADFYPNVKLSAYWGVQALSRGGFDQLFQDGSDIGGIGPAFSLPLFHQSRLKAEYRGYEADYDAAVASYDQTLTKAFQQVADAASSTDSTRDQIAAAQIRRDGARQTLDLVQARFQHGLATKMDLDTARINLASADSAYADLQAQAYNDRIRFIAALGGGFQPE